MGDYGFRSEIEPKISRSEQEILRQVVAKAENQLLDAITYLEGKIDSEAVQPLISLSQPCTTKRTGLPQLARLTCRRSEKFPSF